MNYRIRPLMLSEYLLLSDFLCKAIFLPENVPLLFGLHCSGRSREELVTVLPLRDHNQLLHYIMAKSTAKEAPKDFSAVKRSDAQSGRR